MPLSNQVQFTSGEYAGRTGLMVGGYEAISAKGNATVGVRGIGRVTVPAHQLKRADTSEPIATAPSVGPEVRVVLHSLCIEHGGRKEYPMEGDTGTLVQLDVNPADRKGALARMTDNPLPTGEARFTGSRESVALVQFGCHYYKSRGDKPPKQLTDGKRRMAIPVALLVNAESALPLTRQA